MEISEEVINEIVIELEAIGVLKTLAHHDAAKAVIENTLFRYGYKIEKE